MTITQETIDLCVQWAVENGSVIPAEYKFGFQEGSGIYCYSNGDQTNHDLLKINEKLLLTASVAEAALGKYFTATGHLRTNSLLKTLLVILKKYPESHELEVEGSKLSDFYAPYINVLPDIIDSPLVWNDSELELIKGTDLLLKHKHILHNELLPEYNALMSSVSQDFTKFSLEDYVWAHLIVSSRGFPSVLLESKKGDEAFLWPIVDFLNHDANAKVKWNYSTPFLTFESLSQPASTKEIFNDYGDNKNSDDLLLNYGFVHNDKVHENSTIISLRVPNTNVVAECQKTHFIKFHEVIEQKSSCIVKFQVYSNHRLPTNLIKFFSYLCKLSKEDFLSVRSTLEGLAQLVQILEAKLKLYKLKLTNTNKCRPRVIALVKTYKNVMKQTFQSNIDIIQQFEKNLITSNMNKTMRSFKTCIKEDNVFQNSLLLVFGSFDYNKLKEMGVLQHVLLLYIVKEGKAESGNKVIHEAVLSTANDITIDADDLKEYTPLYNTFFPKLETRIPEVYGNNWTLQDFVVAGTVVDRICWTRPVNQEIFFIEQKPYSLM